MATVLITVAFNYILTSLVVGVSVFAFFKRFVRVPTYPAAFVMMFICFAFADALWLPALQELEITFTIGNKAVAQFLEVAPNSKFIEFFGPGRSDIVIWLIQTGIAAPAGKWLTT